MSEETFIIIIALLVGGFALFSLFLLKRGVSKERRTK